MINTKRIFTALLLAVIAMAGYAYDFEVDGIYYCYDVYGNAVVTHGNKKYTGKIKIPSEVKWNGKKKKVVEIGDYAFECCYELKSVSIPSSVYYIGRFAFRIVKLPNHNPWKAHQNIKKRASTVPKWGKHRAPSGQAQCPKLCPKFL